MAPPTLYPYQEELQLGIRRALAAGHRAVIAQLPTGGGKMVCIAAIAASVASKGGQVVITSHLREINQHLVAGVRAHGMPVRIIQGDTDEGPEDASIVIVSIQTIEARKLVFPDARYLIVDEAHRAASPSVQALIERHPSSRIIGFSATPSRADNRSLEHFTAIVQGPQVSTLVAAGRLAPIVTLSPVTFAHELAADVVSRYPAGRPGIVFGASVKHSQIVTSDFGLRRPDIRAAHLDGTTPTKERDATLAAFQRGDLDVICNYRLLVEGIDVPRAEVCALACSVGSPVAVLQMIGRVRRFVPGKTALLLDLAGNIHRHGLPDEDRTYHLEGDAIRVARAGGAPQSCPACLSWGPAGSACPCGAVRPSAPPPKIKARDLVEQRQREPEPLKEERLRRFVQAAVSRGRNPWSALYVYRGTYNEDPPRGLLKAIIEGRAA
jgi:DNA repair protein RadD